MERGRTNLCGLMAAEQHCATFGRGVGNAGACLRGVPLGCRIDYLKPARMRMTCYDGRHLGPLLVKAAQITLAQEQVSAARRPPVQGGRSGVAFICEDSRATNSEALLALMKAEVG